MRSEVEHPWSTVVQVLNDILPWRMSYGARKETTHLPSPHARTISRDSAAPTTEYMK